MYHFMIYLRLPEDIVPGTIRYFDEIIMIMLLMVMLVTTMIIV